ncbi:MAG: histidine phosphatase family protein [Actinobacteria bacterium]|nr:histidine phosphatase family protein [Actinomycetota bacterium]
MSALVVLRHGRTQANAAGLLLGRLDVDLDEVGRRQAAALAGAVRATSGPIVAVVSSPLARTMQTAAAFEAPVTVDDRFVELDYGAWDGRAISEVSESMWAAWRADPHFRPEGGESLHEVERRVAAACREWAERCTEGVVVVVTHVSPLKAAVGWALGSDVVWQTRVDPASITRIDVGAGRPTLRSFNETGHLEHLTTS